jgi:RNA polymerase sigma factor (TIGR02999 family)
VAEEPSLTVWIQRAVQGQPGALEHLFAELYPELRRIAHARLYVRGQQPLMSTTELVHESFLRFTRARSLALEDRKHFFTYAATVMRHVMIDIAREQQAARRGGGSDHVALDELSPTEHPAAAADETLLEIHAALEELQKLDPTLARVVEMQYFAEIGRASCRERVS